MLCRENHCRQGRPLLRVGGPTGLGLTILGLTVLGVMMAGCVPIPGGNLNSLLGGQSSARDKPTKDAEKKLFQNLELAEDPRYLRNPQAGLVAYTDTDYTQAASMAATADGQAKKTSGGGPVNPLAPANVVIVRLPLRDWDSGESAFDDSPGARAVKSWLAAGRSMGVRIDCRGESDLPSHLARRVPLMESLPGRPPLYWDADYVRYHQELVTWLSRQLEGAADRLQTVIITGADWDSPADWRAAPVGYSDQVHLELVRDLVEHYRGAFLAQDTNGQRKFPHVQLYISRTAVDRCPAKQSALLDILRAARVGILDEGLPPPPGVARANWTAGFRTMLGEGHAAGLTDNPAQRQAAAVQSAVGSLVGSRKPQYLMLSSSAANAPQVCAQLGEALEKGAAAMGPRLRVTKAVMRKTAPYGLDMDIELTWTNTGTTAPDESYLMEVNFLEANNTPAGRSVPRVPSDANTAIPTNTWSPGFGKTFTVKLKTPEKAVGSGIIPFVVSVAMVHPTDPQRRLELSMTDRTTDGRYYRIGKVEVTN